MKHWSRWTDSDCRNAYDENAKLRAALEGLLNNAWEQDGGGDHHIDSFYIQQARRALEDVPAR